MISSGKPKCKPEFHPHQHCCFIADITKGCLEELLDVNEVKGGVPLNAACLYRRNRENAILRGDQVEVAQALHYLKCNPKLLVLNALNPVRDVAFLRQACERAPQGRCPGLDSKFSNIQP